MFNQWRNLLRYLRKKREDRGAIDFDFKESKILVDEDGWPTDVVIRERTVAERLIEEFMLSCERNSCGAFPLAKSTVHLPYSRRSES